MKLFQGKCEINALFKEAREEQRPPGASLVPKDC